MALVWRPAHIGMKRTEIAGKCAKEATKMDNTDITVPFS